jgi:uncharacterized protein YndB with AHSA1/START domain
MLPVHPPSWIHDAPVRVAASRTIAAPAEAVWAVLADHEAWPTWFTTLTTVEVTGAATGVGGRRRVSIGRARLDEEFTAWESAREFSFAVTEVTMRPTRLRTIKVPVVRGMAESIRLTPIGDDRCAVVYEQGIEPTRFGAIVLKGAGKKMETTLHGVLERLEALVLAAG